MCPKKANNLRIYGIDIRQELSALCSTICLLKAIPALIKLTFAYTRICSTNIFVFALKPTQVVIAIIGKCYTHECYTHETTLHK